MKEIQKNTPFLAEDERDFPPTLIDHVMMAIVFGHITYRLLEKLSSGFIAGVMNAFFYGIPNCAAHVLVLIAMTQRGKEKFILYVAALLILYYAYIPAEYFETQFFDFIAKTKEEMDENLPMMNLDVPW